MADFYIKQGDLRPLITSTLRDSTGAVINLTNAAITFKMWLKGAPTATVKVDAAGAIVNPPGTDGKVSYTWVGTDTNTPGRYLAEWQITFTGALPQTHPSNKYLIIDVLPAR